MHLVERHPASQRGSLLRSGPSQMSAAVMTTMGCAWKYLCNLLAAQTSARTSFSIMPVLLLASNGSRFFDALIQGFKEWQRFFRRFGEESIQASQLPIEALDLFDCPWVWELQHDLRLVWARFYPFRTDHLCFRVTLDDQVVHVYLQVPTNLSVKGLVYQSLETLEGVAAEGLDLPIDF
ncbi:hypothetical protein Tco_0958786 [Tanacetum coccineum]